MLELCKSPFFGVALSIFAFWIGIKIQKKTGFTLCNPLIIAIVLIIGVLLLFHIPYDYYNEGGQMIDLFLAPATACLAVSIYTKLQILKENWLPILVGCTAGSAASMASIYGLCRLFRLDEAVTYSQLHCLGCTYRMAACPDAETCCHRISDAKDTYEKRSQYTS